MTTTKQIEVEDLKRLFAGKRVKVTHIASPKHSTVEAEGVCKTFHDGCGRHVDIEMENGHQFGFYSDMITDTFVEGEVRSFIGGRRKVELV